MGGQPKPPQSQLDKRAKLFIALDELEIHNALKVEIPLLAKEINSHGITGQSKKIAQNTIKAIDTAYNFVRTDGKKMVKIHGPSAEYTYEDDMLGVLEGFKSAKIEMREIMFGIARTSWFASHFGSKKIAVGESHVGTKRILDVSVELQKTLNDVRRAWGIYGDTFLKSQYAPSKFFIEKREADRKAMLVQRKKMEAEAAKRRDVSLARQSLAPLVSQAIHLATTLLAESTVTWINRNPLDLGFTVERQ